MIITIVGLGLIGGSIALDLKKRGFTSHVIGVEKNPLHSKLALKLGLVDEIMDLTNAVNQSELILLCIPVDECLKLLPLVLDKINDNQVVCDLSSTKEKLIKYATTHPKFPNYVPSHPMAGTEFTGPNAAHIGLFDLNYVIICNKNNISNHALELVQKMYELLNMNIVYMDASLHDAQVAFVSHLSHISAFALSLTVMSKEKKDKHIFELSGGGFNSTVRLAKSAASMWTPIFIQNKKNVLKALRYYIQILQNISDDIENENISQLNEMIYQANKIKSVIDNKDKIEEKRKKIKA